MILFYRAVVVVVGTYWAVNAQSQQHDEEHNSPKCWARQCRNCLRVDDKHQSCPCTRTQTCTHNSWLSQTTFKMCKFVASKSEKKLKICSCDKQNYSNIQYWGSQWWCSVGVLLLFFQYSLFIWNTRTYPLLPHLLFSPHVCQPCNQAQRRWQSLRRNWWRSSQCWSGEHP